MTKAENEEFFSILGFVGILLSFLVILAISSYIMSSPVPCEPGYVKVKGTEGTVCVAGYVPK